MNAILAVMLASLTGWGLQEQFSGYFGEMTGDDVYVRSGPSRNYYQVTKLDSGKRVRVVGQEGEWLAIESPEGCFSVISKEYVEVSGTGWGRVTGDKVRVYAGSNLVNQFYARQTYLNKSDQVYVLGDFGDRHFKISPPEGVKLFVSAEFVRRLRAEELTSSKVATAPVRTSNPIPVPPSRDHAGQVYSSSDPRRSATSIPSTGTVRVIESSQHTTAPPAVDSSIRYDGTTRIVAADQDSDRGSNIIPIVEADSNIRGHVAESTPSSTPTSGFVVDSSMVVSSGNAHLSGAYDQVGVVSTTEEAGSPGVVGHGDVVPAGTSISSTPSQGYESSYGETGIETGSGVVIETRVLESLRAELDAANDVLAVEMRKPIESRNYGPVRTRFAPLNSQSDDRFVQTYAQRRLAQLDRLEMARNAVLDVRGISTQSVAQVPATSQGAYESPSETDSVESFETHVTSTSQTNTSGGNDESPFQPTTLIHMHDSEQTRRGAQPSQYPAGGMQHSTSTPTVSTPTVVNQEYIIPATGQVGSSSRWNESPGISRTSTYPNTSSPPARMSQVQFPAESNDQTSSSTTYQAHRSMRDPVNPSESYLDAQAALEGTGGSYDAVGELRNSAVFEGTYGLRRFRLVDRGGTTLRTIAYVDIPKGVRFDEARLIGRRVGVRASSRSALSSEVTTVPVLVASEIEMLNGPAPLVSDD